MEIVWLPVANVRAKRLGRRDSNPHYLSVNDLRPAHPLPPLAEGTADGTEVAGVLVEVGPPPRMEATGVEPILPR